jgi:hypothetical protein
MDASTTQAIAASTVAAIASLVAAIVTAYFGYRATRTSKEIADLKGELKRAYRQVAAYHELEDIACEEIAMQRNSSAKTIKTELRDRAVQRNVERPDLTRKQCEKRLSELTA